MEVTLFGILALLLIAIGIGFLIILELRQARRERILLHLLATFGPAIVTGRKDPEMFIAWSQLAETARALFPGSFRSFDAAVAGRFPFSQEVIEAAHARWTADWLAWERQHDIEYKNKAAVVEIALETASESDRPSLRAQLAVVTEEKLRTYQARYEGYVRIGKAIAALEDSPNGRGLTGRD